MPDDVALTFTHDDALGAIEETLHGPFGSPRRFTSGLVSQDSLRFRPDPLDGLNPNRVSSRLRDPLVREGVMHVNLLALHQYASDVAAFRDAERPYRERLGVGAQAFVTQVRAWIRKGPVDPRFAELMDALVRRSDKKTASALAAALRHGRIPVAEARAVWDRYAQCATDGDNSCSSRTT